jgi:predicted amidohydrolase
MRPTVGEDGMARNLKVAAAQLGPNNEGTTRDEIVARMLTLMEQAATEGVAVIAYPEMALTPYFPKRLRDDYEQFFETEVPPRALAPLLARAASHGMACHVGFCENAGGRHFNTAILTDERGEVCGRFRKIHLPGAARPAPFARVYEPRYFEPGDTGYRVFPIARARIGIAICQDRRYCETYRCLGLLGAEVVLIGYNTPMAASALSLNELVMRAGAYENHLFVVAAAKAGVEDGLELIGGSCVISPLGEVLARAATTGDELVVARIDLDQAMEARRRWGFFERRRPEYYGPVTAARSAAETARPR